MSRRIRIDGEFEKYFPEADILTPKEMRQEYSRLRQIANKRLARFEGTPYQDSKAYRYNVGKFKPLKEVANERELKHLLYDVARFVDSKQTTISGIRETRKKIIETAHDRGMSWLNEKNIDDFGRYMEALRAKYGANQFHSERAQEVYGIAAAGKGINSEEILKDYEFWKNHVDELSKVPKIRNKENRTSENYKERIKKLK